MLPFGPHDLPWAEWLLCAFALIVVSGMIYARLLELKGKGKGGPKFAMLMLVLTATLFACLTASFFCAIFGIIRFSNLD